MQGSLWQGHFHIMLPIITEPFANRIAIYASVGGVPVINA